jgi:glutathione peroxidase
MTTVYDFEVEMIDGKKKSLADFKGQTLLIVNTASKCGFTPQYTGLEALHKEFGPKGFAVLGFPCNQFGGQEPGSNAEIAQFCDLTFRTTFPLFSKIDVNGDNTHPLYAHLKKAAPGLLGTEAIKWNFTKFLVDKTGKVVKRFAPNDTPESMTKEIKSILS